MTTIAFFTLRSAATQAAAPFSLGHAFKKGDVPAGAQLVGSIPNLQVVPKNTWPDGSLKFAIVSGRAALTANTPLTVTLSTGTPAGGTALAIADLKATGITAAIDAGAFGSASWAGTAWDTPWQSWVSGPEMSSWVYQKQIGTDAHLVGFIEVRLFAGGAVEVLPWVENGYLNVAGPTNKSTTYAFTLGGTQRFSAAIDLKHHQRTPLLSDSIVSHWLGADPGVSALPDPAYLQASELVPTYSASMAEGAGSVALLPTSFAPLQQGRFNYDGDAMGSSGYQTPIGLLPEHDVLYLVAHSNDRIKTFKSVIWHGYSAGRYGIHYRDEITLRPPAYSTYPTLVIYASGALRDTGASTTGTYTPVEAGGNPPQWDTAHSPSVGYLAYILTGAFYFKEEVQFAATANHFNVTDWVRGGGVGTGSNAPRAPYTGASGLCTGDVQTRSAAWWFRSLAQALAITPDSGDPLRAEFIACVEENCRYFYQIYVAQANNPFGMIRGGEGNYGNIAGVYTVPVWQQDFVTAAWGMALAFDLPVSNTAKTKMAAFFAWKAQGVIGRLGPNGAWWYVNAAPYTMPIGTGTVDYFGGTGPWLANTKAAYDLMAANNVDAPLSTTEGVLGMDYPAASQPSMWHNLHPAIAYAVRHGVSGAQAAYARMTGATNYSGIQAAFNLKPVWSVAPASTPAGGNQIVSGPCTLVDSARLRPGYTVVSKFRGRGVPLSAMPAGALGANKFAGAAVGAELLLEVAPSPYLDLGELTDFSFSGAPDGVYQLAESITLDGVAKTGLLQINVGDTSGGGGGGGAEVTGVTISPATVTMAGGSTQQFTGSVLGPNSPSQALLWTCSPVVGTLTANGAYTAPAADTDTQTIDITATSVADPDFSATATVTVPSVDNGGGFIRSRARTITVKPAPETFAGGPYWNLTDPKKPVGGIDPDAIIDISFDWNEVLADISDTLKQVHFDLTGVISRGGFSANGIATIFVSDASGKPSITCTITTNSAPSRVQERTVFLKVEDQ